MNLRQLTGLLAGFASALIGSGWQLATRHATTTLMPAEDLLLLRYVVPALVLSPLLLAQGWQRALWPVGLRGHVLVVVVAGAGLPFGLLAVNGTRFAPAAHMGVLLAAASPVMAAALAWLLWRERPGPQRLIGLALMAAGVLILSAHAVLPQQGPHTSSYWRGDLLFVAAAALWACYTLGYRRAQRELGADAFTPWRATALVNAWSALAVLAGWALWIAGGGRPPLQAATGSVLLTQLVWQGLLAGVMGLWTFNVAIARLGAAQAAAFGALVPALSAVGGWLWLGEALDASSASAVVVTVLGVGCASGVITRRATRQDHPPQRG